MKEIKYQIAKHLLQINAIKLNPAKPFTWASGWKSPIYCDNRKTLAYPEVRKLISEAFVHHIKEKYPDLEGVAGVATGAIAHGVLVAEALGLPFIYIRASAKGHGLGNRIEGDFQQNQKFVVIEDLVSTGGSSLSAVEALIDAGCSVMGMLAIFTYGFPQAVDNFSKAGCQLDTLSNYEELIAEAEALGYVQSDQIEVLKEWRLNPAVWDFDR